jgi:hypothetical protein
MPPSALEFHCFLAVRTEMMGHPRESYPLSTPGADSRGSGRPARSNCRADVLHDDTMVTEVSWPKVRYFDLWPPMGMLV